jgi:hypothetical protein
MPAAITVLTLVPRFGVGMVRGGIGSAIAAHVNLVFGHRYAIEISAALRITYKLQM